MTPPGDGRLEGIPLCPGEADGELLWLDEPLSFWGGTDLATGVITDVHHPQWGTSLAGRVVVMSASRGSSSSSSVLAEQIRSGVAPAAMLLATRDAIVALGALAAAEVYGVRMPILLTDAAGIPHAGRVRVSAAEDSGVVLWDGCGTSDAV
jgi:predicted aconitase with swiveling domain